MPPVRAGGTGFRSVGVACPLKRLLLDGNRVDGMGVRGMPPPCTRNASNCCCACHASVSAEMWSGYARTSFMGVVGMDNEFGRSWYVGGAMVAAGDIAPAPCSVDPPQPITMGRSE